MKPTNKKMSIRLKDAFSIGQESNTFLTFENNGVHLKFPGILYEKDMGKTLIVYGNVYKFSDCDIVCYTKEPISYEEYNNSNALEDILVYDFALQYKSPKDINKSEFFDWMISMKKEAALNTDEILDLFNEI